MDLNQQLNSLMKEEAKKVFNKLKEMIISTQRNDDNKVG